MDNSELIRELGLKVGSELWKFVIIDRRMKKQDLLSHHYNIAFNNFKRWFEEDIIFSGINMNLGEGKLLLWKIGSGKVEYKSHKQSLIRKVSEPQTEEIQQAIEHLTDGYPDLWQIWLEAKTMSNKILEEVIDLWNDIEETFLRELEQEDPNLPVLSEWNPIEKFETNYFLLEDTIKNIVEEIHHFVDKVQLANFFQIIDENDGNFRVGTSAMILMKTNNKILAEKYAKIAADTIHNSDFIRRTEDLIISQVNVENKLKVFQETLNYIAKQLEQTSTQLEGRCWLCKHIMTIL